MLWELVETVLWFPRSLWARCPPEGPCGQGVHSSGSFRSTGSDLVKLMQTGQVFSPRGGHPTAQTPRGGGPGAGQDNTAASEAQPIWLFWAVEAELR